MTNFEQANQRVHPVQTQWHHKYMTKHGWTPLTLSAVGFVRSYSYEKGERILKCVTGSSSDYWDEEGYAGGYWDSLEKHLENS